MNKAVISLGANIGDSEKILNNAVEIISKLPKTKLLKKSSLYITKPWGYENQRDFHNCAVLIETDFSPNALLGACLGIETTVGRERTFKNAPRVLDLDVIAYENIVMESEELTLPHPFFKERAFVLYPLKDLFEDFKMFDIDFKPFFDKMPKDDIRMKF